MYHLTEENFDIEVLRETGLEEKYRGRVRFCEVEVEESPRLAAVYGADIVPAFLIVRGGAVKAFMKGVVGDEVLEERLKELL